MGIDRIASSMTLESSILLVAVFGLSTPVSARAFEVMADMVHFEAMNIADIVSKLLQSWSSMHFGSDAQS
jgi:hypothetical protein